MKFNTCNINFYCIYYAKYIFSVKFFLALYDFDLFKNAE